MAGRSSTAALAALTLWAVAAAPTPVAAQDVERDSFAALAYLRVPFSARPYLGVAVQKDRVEASRPVTRSYEPLWQQERLLDLHLNPQTMQPLRLNGMDVPGGLGSRTAADGGWTARVERN
ncbi:MAG: hypothetical protein ACK4QW_13920 [Alphaproteobacteria bacterium]